MAWSFWIAVLAGITLVFYLLWRYAAKIEREEEEERRWLEYIQQLQQYDQQQAAYWQWMFEQRYKTR